MSLESEGKARGGHARAEVLSPSKRSEIARKAATARWDDSVPRATHEGELDIGGIKIPCAVLADGQRLLTQWGFYRAIGRSGRPTAGRGSDFEKIAPFLDLDNLKPYVSEELASSTRPVLFRLSRGVRAHGYRAELLPKVCDVYLRARGNGVLLKSQEKFAAACEILVRGLAHIGIVALVDEATGYQHDRAKDALAKILEAFIAKELQPWVKTFPSEYYQELFRLRGLEYPMASVKRPQYFGTLTNDIVYKRLAPGVLEELKRLTPRNDEGRPRNKYFQRLTSNIGYPKLREHLGAVIATMQLSTDYPDFMRKLNRIRPPIGQTFELPFPYVEDQDDGKGL